MQKNKQISDQDNVKTKQLGKNCSFIKNRVRVTSYFDKIHVDDISEYGVKIGSMSLSNTVRSIVLQFLYNRTTNTISNSFNC